MRKGVFLAILLLTVILYAPGGEPQGTADPYHFSFEIAEVLRNISLENPDIASYHTADDLLGTREITGGRDIPVLLLGEPEKERPWVMVIGAHHGDEPDSAEAVLAFAEHIASSYASGDGRARSILSRTNIAVLPVVNPYGLDMGTRYDENGEDPNRDYPFEPSTVSPYSDGVPLTTAGAHAVHSLAQMYPFSTALSFHTGSKGIFYSWGAPNVGTFTPDHNAFFEMGMMLSRASGQDLLHGPANSFSYVAYLAGAFDDHLYGSSFMSDHLYSPNMSLPWSTFALTVELDTPKGKNPGNLGDTEDLWEDPIEDMGVVPMGVRICYSACMMAAPAMDADLLMKNDTIEIEGTVSGAVSVGEPVIRIDGEEIPYEIEWSPGRWLPEMYFTVQVEAPGGTGSHSISFETAADRKWAEPFEGSDQEGGPRTLIALSRKDLTLEWGTSFETDAGPEGTPTVELLPRKLVFEAGEPSEVDLMMDLANRTPVEMSIVITTGDWSETTVFERDEIIEGEWRYSFSTVPKAGPANLTVNLTCVNATAFLSTPVELVPAVEILSVDRTAGYEDTWKILIGVTGGSGPTPVYWGVSRNMEQEWTSDDWAVAPRVEISPGYGPLTVEVDLSGYSGELYFRASGAIRDIVSSPHLVSYQPLEPSGGIVLTPVGWKMDGSDLLLGPALVISNIDGREVLSPYSTGLSYEITLRSREGNEDLTAELYFEEMEHLTPEEAAEVEGIAARYGSEEVPGAFYGRILDADLKGRYTMVSTVEGYVALEGVPDHNIEVEVIIGMVEVEGQEEEDDEKELPWLLISFIFSMGILMLIITYLRYSHHTRDPVPEEGQDKRPRTHVGSRPGDRPMRTARRPPWR